jgi:hypothetical protein
MAGQACRGSGQAWAPASRVTLQTVILPSVSHKPSRAPTLATCQPPLFSPQSVIARLAPRRATLQMARRLSSLAALLLLALLFLAAHTTPCLALSSSGAGCHVAWGVGCRSSSLPLSDRPTDRVLLIAPSHQACRSTCGCTCWMWSPTGTCSSWGRCVCARVCASVGVVPHRTAHWHRCPDRFRGAACVGSGSLCGKALSSHQQAQGQPAAGAAAAAVDANPGSPGWRCDPAPAPPLQCSCARMR